MKVFFVLGMLDSVSGHGALTQPKPRNMVSKVTDGMLWFNNGCATDCPTCTGKSQRDCNPLRNLKRQRQKITDGNPWTHPGHAPLIDACGVAADPVEKGPPAGHKPGDLGSKLPPIHTPIKWMAGSDVDVSWNLYVDHKGGYQYRLCPASEQPTESCFMKMPLPFASKTYRVRNQDKPGKYVETKDRGTWAAHENLAMYVPIWDKVHISSSIQPGKYILQWRWDCLLNPQVWTNCADVEITEKSDENLTVVNDTALV